MKKIIWLSIVYTVIPALLFMLVGCMKDPGPNESFGTEVAATDVNNSLNAAQVASTLSTMPNIQKGEYSYVERTNQVETLFPVTMELHADTVTNIVTNPSTSVYTITRNLYSLDDSGTNMVPYPPTQMTECAEATPGACSAVGKLMQKRSVMMAHHAPSHSLRWLKQTEGKVVQSLQSLLSFVQVKAIGDAKADGGGIGPTYGIKAANIGSLTYQSATSSNSNDGIQWTYYNLTRTSMTMPLPSQVNLRSDCGGRVNPCQTPLQATQITWDQVDWTSEQYPVKYSYQLIFSAEVPYFSSLITSCGTTTIPYNGERISIMQCENVKDFAFGKGK